MIASRIRPFSVLKFLAGVGVIYYALTALHYIGVAHAVAVTEDGVPPIRVVEGGVDWVAVVAVIALVVSAVNLIILGIAKGLKAIAPYTTTTLDDRGAVFFQGLHDKLDEVLRILPGARAAPTVTVTNVAAPAPAAPEVTP